MAITLECKVSWKKSNPLGMASVGEKSVTKMTGNTAVPTPRIPLSVISTACALVRSTFPTRLGNDDERLAASNAVTDLDEKLHEQILYVDEQANGDDVIIVSCGFVATSATKTKAVISDPLVSVVITPKAGGTIKLNADMPIGAKSIVYFVFTQGVFDLIIENDNTIIIPDDAKGVRLVPRGKARQTVKGLSAFASVSVVGYAVNAAGISAASIVFTSKIL
jgi:hypothetical protein